MRAAWLVLLAACCALPHIGSSQQDPDATDGSASPVSGGASATLPPAPNLPLDRITLPPGFSISLYVDSTFPARFFALGKADTNNTVVFVSSTKGTVSWQPQLSSSCLPARLPGGQHSRRASRFSRAFLMR